MHLKLIRFLLQKINLKWFFKVKFYRNIFGIKRKDQKFKIIKKKTKQIIQKIFYFIRKVFYSVIYELLHIHVKKDLQRTLENFRSFYRSHDIKSYFIVHGNFKLTFEKYSYKIKRLYEKEFFTSLTANVNFSF